VLGDGLVVVDVGAGVGWLSNRMYGLGHIRTPST
jgi:2-polyprenyl-3-methyl-5-hydroxy-6-metoxy-1,4-benzoquinol methylase